MVGDWYRKKGGGKGKGEVEGKGKAKGKTAKKTEAESVSQVKYQNPRYVDDENAKGGDDFEKS